MSVLKITKDNSNKIIVKFHMNLSEYINPIDFTIAKRIAWSSIFTQKNNINSNVVLINGFL